MCTQCHALLDPSSEATPFDLLGLETAYALDEQVLRKALLRYSRMLHPDFHGADEDSRSRAERNTADLNAAHELLQDDFRRAAWLVTHLGGPSQHDERKMPPVFLVEALDWNETIEEAQTAEPGSPAFDALESLETELVGQREETMATVAGALTPLPDRGSETLTTVRRHLNAVRYLDRALGEIRERKLAALSTPH